MSLINTANELLPMSPIVSMSRPTLTNVVNNNAIITASDNAVNIGKDLISFQNSSDDLAATSCKILSPSAMPIMTPTIEFEGNHQVSVASCDPSASHAPLSKTSNEPKARFLSKETENQDGFTETSIEIISESLLYHSKQPLRLLT